MSLDDFRLVLTWPVDVFYGVFFRYLIMPLVGWRGQNVTSAAGAGGGHGAVGRLPERHGF